MEIEDLVVLQYAPNNCYVQVVSAEDCPDLRDGKLQIGIIGGRWSYDKDWKDIEIGRARSLDRRGAEHREGVIGVYDRRNVIHLSNMVAVAREFTESSDSSED